MDYFKEQQKTKYSTKQEDQLLDFKLQINVTMQLVFRTCRNIWPFTFDFATKYENASNYLIFNNKIDIIYAIMHSHMTSHNRVFSQDLYPYFIGVLRSHDGTYRHCFCMPHCKKSWKIKALGQACWQNPLVFPDFFL